MDDVLSFFQLLEQHFDLSMFIPQTFYHAFYQSLGRKRAYPLTGFLSALILQKIFSIPTDTLLILLLNLCKKLKSFCGFSNVPDAPLFTRFKLRFSDHIELMFQQMVDYTEPICRQIVSPQPQVPYHSIIFLRKCLLKHITRIAQIERFALYSTQQSLFLN